MSTNIRGIVLAGGKSSRFGSNKALAKYQGTSLLKRALKLLKSLDLEPAIIASQDHDYSSFKYPCFQDELPEKGPLGGLYTAMTHFPESRLLVLTCDMPALTTGVLMPLLRKHKKKNRVTLYQIGSKSYEPFPGVYESSLRDGILNRITENKLSMQSLFEDLPQKNILPWDKESQFFSNVNSASDL